MKNVILTIGILVLLSSCGSSGGAAKSLAAKLPAPGISQPITDPAPATTPAPQTVDLVVYSLLASYPMPNGCLSSDMDSVGTATGYCTIFNSKTYCWDDGTHYTTGNVCTTNYGPSGWGYSYWNDTSDEDVNNPDTWDQPKDWSSQPALGNDSQQSVINLMNQGTPSNVTCTPVDANHLDCGSFVIVF